MVLILVGALLLLTGVIFIVLQPLKGGEGLRGGGTRPQRKFSSLKDLAGAWA